MVEAIRDTLDCNPVFHGNVVSINQMIGIMMGKYSCIWNYLLYGYIVVSG